MNDLQRIVISKMESIDRCYMLLCRVAELQELCTLMTSEDMQHLNKILQAIKDAERSAS